MQRNCCNLCGCKDYPSCNVPINNGTDAEMCYSCIEEPTGFHYKIAANGERYSVDIMEDDDVCNDCEQLTENCECEIEDDEEED